MRWKKVVSAAFFLLIPGAVFVSGPTTLLARTRNTHSFGRQFVPEVQVRVYGWPDLSAWVLDGAETEAARMLRPANIKLQWIDCTSQRSSASCTSNEGGGDLILRIIPKALPQTSKSALGAAGSSGGYGAAFVFYDRVTALRAQTRLMPIMLGRVMAHEIVHLLLPHDDHSSLGLMRGLWSSDDLMVANDACVGLPTQTAQAIQKEAFRRLVTYGRLAR